MVDLVLCFSELVLEILYLSICVLVQKNRDTTRPNTYLMDDILRLVSLVNWHFTLRLEHSEQLDVSVASHLQKVSNVIFSTAWSQNTLTLRSRQASQLGSFLLCR
jgi:hypothetical protein